MLLHNGDLFKVSEGLLHSLSPCLFLNHVAMSLSLATAGSPPAPSQVSYLFLLSLFIFVVCLQL